jgi:hypothetical protein
MLLAFSICTAPSPSVPHLLVLDEKAGAFSTHERMARPMRTLLLFVLLASNMFRSVNADAELPLFDGHIHYSGNAWEEYPPEKAVELLRQAGIKKALLSSTPNEGTHKLLAVESKLFIPELRVYRKATSLETWFAERASWWRDPETVGYLKSELERGIYRGIGEFHLNGNEADSDVIKQMVELAVGKNLIMHAHSDAAAIDKLFAHDPKARILWAHAGITTPIDVIEKHLERYANLWVELSYRYDVANPDGALDAKWRALFLRFPDRFVTGSDTWEPGRWPQVPALAAWARKWLGQLPREVAEQIAYKTGQKLYGFDLEK